MKKLVLILACIALMLFSGCADAQTRNGEMIRLTLESADELNEHSDFGSFCGLLQTKGVRTLPALKHLDNRTDCCTIMEFDGKPRITQISLSTADYHVFGIRVGDDIGSVDEVMTAFGYTKADSAQSHRLVYKKHRISISFSYNPDDQLIYEIFAGADDGMSDGKIY